MDLYTREQMDQLRQASEALGRRVHTLEDQIRTANALATQSQRLIDQATERAEKALADLRSAKAQWDHESRVLARQLHEALDRAHKAEQRAHEAEQRAASIRAKHEPRAKGLPGIAEAVADVLDDLAEEGHGHG